MMVKQVDVSELNFYLDPEMNVMTWQLYVPYIQVLSLLSRNYFRHLYHHPSYTSTYLPSLPRTTNYATIPQSRTTTYITQSTILER